MQAYPVANFHSRSAPLLAYLRLLGVEPTITGTLHVGRGAYFHSPVLTVNPDGSGTLPGHLGPVTVTTATGRLIPPTDGPSAWRS